MSAPSAGVATRRPVLRRLAHCLYALPGGKTLTRHAVRGFMQTVPLSLKKRERLYNFFVHDPALWGDAVRCRVSPPGGKPVALELDLEDWISRIWFYAGYSDYETATVGLIATLLKSKRCFFDVGANVGYYSLLAASALQGRGEVHAFEPFPRVFRWLSRNVESNSFPGVYLNPAALWDSDGEAELLIPPNPESAGEASLIPGLFEPGERTRVKTVRFDTYCRTRGIERVDLVKLDVQGAELQVLQGMGRLLDQWTPDLICEVWAPFDIELNRFFFEKPYRKFRITDAGLQETDRITAPVYPDPWNYYLSCRPPVPEH